MNGLERGPSSTPSVIGLRVAPSLSSRGDRAPTQAVMRQGNGDRSPRQPSYGSRAVSVLLGCPYLATRRRRDAKPAAIRPMATSGRVSGSGTVPTRS
jgi:hypothetical protein